MKRAWRIFRAYPTMIFSQALKRSWQIERENTMAVSPQVFLKIINNLSPVCIKGTKEHFRLLNSRKGRKVMKLPESNETRQMLSEGVVFQNDIFKDRRRDSGKYNFQRKKQRPFRNRIINPENCERINIQQYVQEHSCPV